MNKITVFFLQAEDVYQKNVRFGSELKNHVPQLKHYLRHKFRKIILFQDY